MDTTYYWAFMIARYEVLKYRRKKATDRLVFSEDVHGERGEGLAMKATAVWGILGAAVTTGCLSTIDHSGVDMKLREDRNAFKQADSDDWGI